jgi:hypothetical protein
MMVTADHTPVASSRVNTRAAPVKSQVEESNSETGRGSGVPELPWQNWLRPAPRQGRATAHSANAPRTRDRLAMAYWVGPEPGSVRLGDLPVPAGPPNSHCRHRACRHARSGDASRYRPRSAPPRRASPPERIPEVVGADLRAGRGDGSTEVHGRPPPDVARIDLERSGRGSTLAGVGRGTLALAGAARGSLALLVSNPRDDLDPWGTSQGCLLRCAQSTTVPSTGRFSTLPATRSSAVYIARRSAPAEATYPGAP